MKLAKGIKEISELGEERKFVCGDKNWRITYAIVSDMQIEGDMRFEIGSKVEWTDPDDDKVYKGKIDWMIYIEGGEVQVSLKNVPLGRLDVTELILYNV